VSNQAIFWAGLMGAATIPIVQMAAMAATTSEIAQTAKAITVQIISDRNNTGSGVIIQQQGDVYTVLTAAHVVRAKNVAYTISTPDGKQYQLIGSSIRRPSVDIDLAVVKFRSSANYATAKLGNSKLLRQGMDVYMAGYPGATPVITKSLFLFKRGTVISNNNSNEVIDSGYSLIYNNQTIAGMSGGPVLDRDGELIAIHGRGERDLISGDKNGNNLGVPIELFMSIASSLGVNFKTATTTSEIARSAKAITVQISTDRDTFGSGAIVQRQGDVYTVLTVGHVVRTRSKNSTYTITTSDGKKYQVTSDSIRRPAGDIDLAVVKFRSAVNYPTAKLGNSNSLREGMDVYVAGYKFSDTADNTAITKSVFMFTSGIVISNTNQILDGGYSLIYDNETAPGMSGGPVLNQNSELIAIHGRKDRYLNSRGESSITNGNQIGIAIERFRSIASSLGVNLTEK
jgi:S1-C subfamily serine protease